MDARAVYPEDAAAARVAGVVILDITIAPGGEVRDAKLLRGIPLLDQAALDAVKQWEFTPTRLNGMPVPVIVTVTVAFGPDRYYFVRFVARRRPGIVGRSEPSRRRGLTMAGNRLARAEFHVG